MPTQRPFFANFFSAFRARSTPGPFQAKSSTTTGAIIQPALLTASAHISTSASAPSRIVAQSKTGTEGHTTQTTTSALPIKSAGTSPFGASAVVSGSPGTTTTFYRRPPSPGPTHNLAKSPTAHITPTHMTRGRQRRDSGSSHTSSGFMDAAGPEKWYVGGRTATGEERFYQLGVITGHDSKRVRSLDRLSL